MTLSHILTFAGVMLLGAMSPGPDFAVVVRRAVAGRGSGMLTALGVAVGVVVRAVAAATGAAALLAVSATAFTVIKPVGAAYPGYPGIRALLSAARRGPAAEAERTACGRWRDRRFAARARRAPRPHPRRYRRPEYCTCSS
jgi:threonine/homoserine/homoserine lactone efflux protein